ncbi:helix-turn-helix domain-containing protein [Xanthocytophaga flava]|uniref:helix-turn-helix domain-containing protein n=1 Tax=Xanthocytophaga flava TaxID=3048013 RepID=UPI0028D7F88A|nr:helix-turn-helix domain-containing protein [Xanthocytophaga flavus]MDJ1470168.1 helix-turn-helix domain-containing protein [Xanthocytophaga flavus]
MAEKLLNLPQFLKYLRLSGVKDDDFHIVNFAIDDHGLLKSAPVGIDFYILALKPPIHKDLVYQVPVGEQSSSFMIAQSPYTSQSWDIQPPAEGYVIYASSRYIEKIAKNYHFFDYNGTMEAIFLTMDENILLSDLYRKAYDEFKKVKFNKQILISYIVLILNYTQTFYDRQFQSRSKVYNKVIADFHHHIEQYFSGHEVVTGLPSVAYFAQKSSLSPNYFGDLIKQLTGKSPIEHIQGHIIDVSKQKLLTTSLSISEISYSLGFDYPNYFARFFRKHTGFSPKAYRDR